jgi:hypothetical protein
VAGTRAVDEARWADAVESFRRSYDLSANPAALFNVGVALRALGRHVEARDAFSRLVEEHGASVATDLATRAREMLEEERARIATVTVRAPAGCVLTVDGEAKGTTTASPESIDLDAGVHELRAECEGREPFEWSREVAEAARVEVVVDPPRVVRAARTTDGAPPASDGPGAGPWVVLGGGLAVAAAGAVLLGVGIADTSVVEGATVGTPFDEVEGNYDRARVLAWLGPLVLGVGAAAAVAAITWRVASSSSASVEVSVGGVRVRGTF